ncbi:MAG: hypothetical protein HXS41_08345 [Theionarchaea archaeon]|nr:hypothetical protein [Theionarchaea archaeon]MBU7001625.1 hypothetical protein [Theionarchaea archaeon]MBU7021056.1 hypothetical protein [Theionarchaea archaeon]MBU7035914.1 hypothetical protein [Theionarchaea archaeon]MBU7041729.1 hypothetical protein [Theionarchaea archaeon]
MKSLAAILFIIVLGAAQGSCSVPVWNEGDTWVWEVAEPGIGKSREVFLSEKKEVNLLTSVVQGKEFIEGAECYHDYETYDGHPESEYHSYYLVSCPPTEHHGIQYDTRTKKPVMKSTIDPGNYIVQFPLYVGQTWNESYTFVEWTYQEESDAWTQTSEIAVEIEAHVTGIESVTVPAGTFEAYKIEVMYYTFKMVKSIIWYSPEVKNSIRGEAYVIEDKIPHLYYEYQLVDYHLAQPFLLEMGVTATVIIVVAVLAYYIYYKKKKR